MAKRTHRRSSPAKAVARRGVLKSAAKLAGAAAILQAAAALIPGGAWAAGSEGLEKTKLSLGIIPLTDCAPIVTALAKGCFQRHGLDVAVSREASWANIRDKVAVGALDGAHMLAAMPIAATLGLGGIKRPMIAASALDLNGNAITVSNTLYARMVEGDPEAMVERPLTARALKKVIDAHNAGGAPPLTFASVFPYSTHNYQLRYWMADAGIDPDRDVRLIVIPPPQMVANLRAGNIVGYCVGEPWNAHAVASGLGRVLITSHEFWNNSPEKVLGVTRDWAEKHPNTHRALTRALVEAARWMDDPANRLEVAHIVSEYVDAPLDVVKMSMTGTFRYAPDEPPRALPDFNVFYRYAATFPWRSHAEWLVSQMKRWGQVPHALDGGEIAAAVYRPDIYREAVRPLRIPTPTIDTKSEGTHDRPWVLMQATGPIDMGPDRFFDGRVFEPTAADAYLAAFAIGRHAPPASSTV